MEGRIVKGSSSTRPIVGPDVEGLIESGLDGAGSISESDDTMIALRALRRFRRSTVAAALLEDVGGLSSGSHDRNDSSKVSTRF